jgi:hypothetical protein
MQLDADGNGTAAVLAGPDCAAGESLITAHMEQEPFETFTTSFTVLPPQATPPGLYVLPESQVEDSFSSAFAAIVQTEYGEGSEKPVRLASEELFHRCRALPHLHWFHFGLGIDHPGVEDSEGPELNGLKLDNDGNAFAVVIGDSSCAPGSSLLESDLEAKPFTTFTASFTILPPQPTAEPAVTIEKLQEIEGSGAGLTSSPLHGQPGQTVDYEIFVKNTAPVPEQLSALSDPHCDPGTLVGGPGGAALAPGETTTYTCSHALAVGRYTNEATVTATTAGGTPLTRTSNQVVVEVPASPGFTIEKRQRIAGGETEFTTATLTASSGQTVEYQITVTNTGNQPLALSGFSDEYCDAGTVAGGPGQGALAPGASTSFTCTHLLTASGRLVNVATVTGTPPGEAPISHTSNPVVVEVPGEPRPGPAFTIEKLQSDATKAPGKFTTGVLAPVPEKDTLEYRIVVHNTGSVNLTFAGFSDAHCDGGTISGGPGATAVPPGGATTYTCRHVMGKEPKYENDASVTGAAPGFAPITHVSNLVEARHAVEPICESRPLLLLRGASGPKVRPFGMHVTSQALKQVSLYLDGHRIKTWRPKAHGTSRLLLRIKLRGLAYGGHRVSAKTKPINAVCKAVVASQSFIRTRPGPPIPPPG